MASLNKVMIIGNVGRDPEMRFTPSAQPVTSFSVAVNNKYQPEGGEAKETTEWFNVVAWNKLAEVCNQLLTKGRKVYVEGRLQTRSWDDKESGAKKYRTELVANAMLLLDFKPQAEDTTEIAADDVPF